MNNNTNLKYYLPVFMSFYIMGFVDIVGVATGYVQKDFGLSDSVAQILPMMVFIWFALMAIPTGIFQDRKGKKITVNIGIILTGVGMLIPFLHYTYTTVLIGFALLGIANTIIQVSANPLLIDISSKGNKAANLTLSQFIKAIASMLGPIITAALARYTGDWKLIFPIYAVISVFGFIWLNSIKIEKTHEEKSPATLKTVFNLLKNPFILVMIFAMFLIVGFDVSMNSNIARFLTTSFSVDIDTASIGISVYFASLMTGRLSGSFLLRVIKPNIFLVVSTIITLIGLLGLTIASNFNIALIMILIAGLGFSNIFPILFAIIVENKPQYANELSGLIIFAVSGGAIIPPIMGMIRQNFGVTASIFVLIACILYVSYASYRVITKKN